MYNYFVHRRRIVGCFSSTVTHLHAITLWGLHAGTSLTQMSGCTLQIKYSYITNIYCEFSNILLNEMTSLHAQIISRII